jgi:hypothetical protein
MVECTRNGWEVPLEDENGEQTGQLKIIWGDDNDEIDPITQVRQFSVALELKGVDNADTDLQSVREIVPLRLFTTQAIAALAVIGGRIDLHTERGCQGLGLRRDDAIR